MSKFKRGEDPNDLTQVIARSKSLNSEKEFHLNDLIAEIGGERGTVRSALSTLEIRGKVLSLGDSRFIKPVSYWRVNRMPIAPNPPPWPLRPKEWQR